MLKYRRKLFWQYSKSTNKLEEKNINIDKKAPRAKEPFLSKSARKKFAYFFAAFIFVIILKLFFIDAYLIPTPSMANTLISGDNIIINKTAYSISTPTYIPFTAITLEPKNLILFSTPGRGDVVVFQFPEANKMLPPAGLYFVKRIIGLPGDTLTIKNKIVFINGRQQTLPGKAKIDTTNFRLTGDSTLFFKNKNWTADNMGPVVVPYKGMTIELNHQNIYKWGMIINREYGKKVVSVEGTVITINGTPARQYILQKNYYFLMGDNRDNSIDSRYHGFVPENFITGKAMFIYWSSGSAIRWNRIFKTVK